jgi:hypothetical protein
MSDPTSTHQQPPFVRQGCSQWARGANQKEYAMPDPNDDYATCGPSQLAEGALALADAFAESAGRRIVRHQPYAYVVIDVTDADEPPSGREPEDRASIVLDRDLERARAEARRWNAVEGDDYCGYRVYALTEVTP